MAKGSDPVDPPPHRKSIGRIHAKAGGVFVQSVNLASDGIKLDYHRSPEPVEGRLSGWRHSREAPFDGRSRHATAAQGYGGVSRQRGPPRAFILAPQRAAQYAHIGPAIHRH
jgi:hypothetical protein